MGSNIQYWPSFASKGMMLKEGASLSETETVAWYKQECRVREMVQGKGTTLYTAGSRSIWVPHMDPQSMDRKNPKQRAKSKLWFASQTKKQNVNIPSKWSS